MMYMRIEQAARFLEVSVVTIRKMIKDGRIKNYRKETTAGHPGPPAYEISATELLQIKQDRAAKKIKNIEPVVETRVVEQRSERDIQEIRKLLSELRCIMTREAECIGKLMEKLI